MVSVSFNLLPFNICFSTSGIFSGFWKIRLVFFYKFLFTWDLIGCFSDIWTKVHISVKRKTLLEYQLSWGVFVAWKQIFCYLAVYDTTIWCNSSLFVGLIGLIVINRKTTFYDIKAPHEHYQREHKALRLICSSLVILFAIYRPNWVIYRLDVIFWTRYDIDLKFCPVIQFIKTWLFSIDAFWSQHLFMT